MSPKKLKVGVTLYVRKGFQSLWENGIFQNCLFLVMLLEKAPHVERAYLVQGGDGEAEHRQQLLNEVPLDTLSLDEAAQQLDVIIEMSAQLDPAWVTAFRAKGGKVISAHVGNDYMIDAERMIFNRPNAHLMSGSPYHQVWTLPEYESTCVSYYEAAMRAPVKIMPHLWSPVVIERASRTMADAHYGYQAGAKSWRVALFEPNICMVKTGFIPLLACEVAHRRSPGALSRVLAFNTRHLMANSTMIGFCDALDIHRLGLVQYEARAATYEVMAKMADAVVSHHLENGQNYLYYELLWGGYPLIHNSEFVGDCGYYYPGLDCEDGGLALLEALRSHDANLADYKLRAQKYLKTVDPLATDNVLAYDRAIVELYDQ